MKNLSTRGRVAVVVVLSAVPALALMVYGALEQRYLAESHAREELRRYARLVAARKEQTLEHARHLLTASAGAVPALLRDRQACHEHFRELMRAAGGLYQSLGLYRASGDLQCNARAWDDGVNVRDRPYFREAVDSGRFSVGGYRAGRAAGRDGIDLGLPVHDADGEVVAVQFARLDVRLLGELVSALPRPPGAVVTLLDRDGIVLAQLPPQGARAGDKLSEPRLSHAMSTAGSGVLETTDAGGAPRVYVFQGVAEIPDGAPLLRVVAGVPQGVIYAEARATFIKTLGSLVAVTMLLLLGGWYGAEIMVLRNLRKLLDVARRVQSGDLTARTRLPGGREEVSRLGEAFDQMAQALQDRDAELQRALRETRELAITDPLTGLHNRRYLWELLGRELLKARRNRTPVAAILADIDYFKRFNDAWGHEAGDFVLKRVADVIREHVRGSDIGCRYGGEELAVVLPDATLEVAVERAERLRRGIAALRLEHDGQPLDAVTASFGVAIYPAHARDAEALLRAADEALYEAKKAGRNRIEVSRSNSA
ncbi:MAG TPA: diguanylate cyclase [Burkholderiales bacterium]|jgi:diguanylate cyclase (GGDEF)-like protein